MTAYDSVTILAKSPEFPSNMDLRKARTTQYAGLGHSN